MSEKNLYIIRKSFNFKVCLKVSSHIVCDWFLEGGSHQKATCNMKSVLPTKEFQCKQTNTVLHLGIHRKKDFIQVNIEGSSMLDTGYIKVIPCKYI